MIKLLLALAASLAAHALVNVPVANLRDEPRHASQLVSQALLGTPLVLVDTIVAPAGWRVVMTPDGYSGFMTEASLHECDLERWQSLPRLIVTDPAGCTLVARRGSDDERDVVVSLPLNSIVVAGEGGACLLPDGRRGFPTDAAALAPLDRWAAQPFDGDKIVATAYALRGAPYLWGGLSADAMDCSGLVSLCYMANGRITPRDAWMLARDAVPATVPLSAGDLIFFDRSGRGRVDHVAIYDRDSLYIHSSVMVKVNALPGSHAGADTITGRITGVGRLGPGDDAAALPARLHPLYFRQTVKRLD